ncbi:MAG: hypothetical protein IKI04_01495 [Bacilli bacterium]|nr:hypothetical protein [Bacilli bacterium]
MKKIFLTLILFVGIFSLTACGKEKINKDILGTWINDTTIEGYKFTYRFNEDGTGTYDVAGNIMNFKYTIDGANISFKYTDEEMETWDTTFSITDDVLNIKDSLGEDTLYKKEILQ